MREIASSPEADRNDKIKDSSSAERDQNDTVRQAQGDRQGRNDNTGIFYFV